MSITCNVVAGQVYGAHYTVDYTDLNKLGTPTVTVPDGGTIAFTLAKLAAGTSAAPSLTFTADLDTGFYWAGNNVIGIAGQLGAADGTLAAPAISFASDLAAGFYAAAPNRIGVAGQLAHADGTLATPGITFATDPDSGFARTAANSFAAIAGGAAVATFSATGIDAVGLTVGGIPVAMSTIDTAYARLYTDFHCDLASAGWKIDYVADGVLFQVPDFSLPGRVGRGSARARLNVNGDSAEAFYPKPGAGWGTYTSNISAGSGLTLFDATGEWVEFGFRLTSLLGTPSNCAKVAVGLSPYPYNAGSSIRLEYNPITNSNFVLYAGSYTAVTSIAPALDTDYRVRITKTATAATVHINGVLQATTANYPSLAQLHLYWGARTGNGFPQGPVLEVDYAAWERPVTRA